MAIPFSYNVRNLMVRKTTTIMTSVGIILRVAVLVASLALVNGLRTVFVIRTSAAATGSAKGPNFGLVAASFPPIRLRSCGPRQALP